MIGADEHIQTKHVVWIATRSFRSRRLVDRPARHQPLPPTRRRFQPSRHATAGSVPGTTHAPGTRPGGMSLDQDRHTQARAR